MPKVKVNGIEVEVPPGTNMIEAAAKVGVEIPHYCYHPHLSVAGNCRMCLVDIEAGGRGPDIACNMVARDGLAIRTDTPNVVTMRKHVMEFLLVNHPLDCPICDQAGECRLQDYYMEYGAYESRSADAKVNKHKRQDVGEHIVLDAERCVQCSRCVRFGDEITHTGELRLFNRGNHTEIGLFPGERLGHHYQGCLADICPVGALTSKDFRFEKRVWYMKEEPSICTGCATGCNVLLGHDQGKVFRYKPRRNDAVNQSWMCDEGRDTHRDIQSTKRLLRARLDGAPAEPSAVVAAVLEALNAVKASKGEAGIGFVLGAKATNEANWALLQLRAKVAPGARVFFVEGNDPGSSTLQDDFLIDADKNPNTRGARILATHAGAGDAAALQGALGELGLLVVLQDDVLGRLGASFSGILCFLGTYANGTQAQAKLVLPVSAHAEEDATFVNRQGRVQRLRRVLPPAGDSLPGHRLVHDVAAAMGQALGTTMAPATFAAMAGAVAEFAGLTYQILGDEGALVASARPAPPPAPEAQASPAP